MYIGFQFKMSYRFLNFNTCQPYLKLMQQAAVYFHQAGNLLVKNYNCFGYRAALGISKQVKKIVKPKH